MSVLPQARSEGNFICRIPFVLSARTVAFAWLLALTLLAASFSFKGLSPVDARTNEFIGDSAATFEMSFLGSVLEPFAAIAHITVGAPDYRIAAISTICWLFAGIALAIYWKQRNIRCAPGICTLKSCAAGLAGASFYVLYMFSAIMLPFPGWSLTPREREVITVDLHSHTFASRDGLASLDENLDYHRARGYGVAAITDHFSLSSRSKVHPLASEAELSIGIIRGSELSISNFGKQEIYLLVLGGRPDLVLPFPLGNHESSTFDDQISRLIERVHDAHGAVLASCYHLHPSDVDRLVKIGIDGFEIANFGHPNISEEVRDALIQAQKSHRIALVANSDWHGWGAFARTWTLIRPVNAAGRPSDEVISALRARNPERIVPVVSQVVGRPSLLRSAFAPLVEFVRYARELTPLRLLSWWIWICVLSALALCLRRFAYHPMRCFAAGIMTVLGVGLLFRGLELVNAWFSGTLFIFPLQIGALSCGLGIFSLLAACGIILYRGPVPASRHG